MKYYYLLAFPLLAAVLVRSQLQCSTSSDLCSPGISLPTIGGYCTSRFLLCDDGDETTQSTCVNSVCQHTTNLADSPKCYSSCVPECEGKECGEDGCGGFCGKCSDGTGCSNFICVEGVLSGTCESPLNLGNTDEETIIDTETRVTLITTGDTSDALHFHTPSCNTLTASPELIFKFVIPSGKTYGYDFRSTGYDTVLQLMKDGCGSAGTPGQDHEDYIVGCNDDGTPPANLGSKLFGEISQGTYYVMVDGYSTTDVGPFELITTFINGCIPLCDGNFCGDDQCGGSCGDCGEGNVCNVDHRCYPENCEPQCTDRECGEDGCGGYCGTCDDGLFCLGESILTDEDDEELPTSACTSFQVCDHMNPTCDGCEESQVCGTDCQCYDSPNALPDLVVVEEGMLNEMYLHDVDFPESSCSLIEGCVAEPGLRRLLRFTSTVLNQGHVDLSFPEPKSRPDLFEYGQCHQHYHFKQFAAYNLYEQGGKTLVMNGSKKAYCMEDTARHHDGMSIGCDKVYDCGFQGIQRGWVDSYGWSLDCSWLDITELPPGEYVLEIEANPGRVFPELSYDNNKAMVRVTLPDVSEVVSVPRKLETSAFSEFVVPVNEGSSAAPTTHAFGWSILALVFGYYYLFDHYN
ncbi:glycosyl hydrolase family 16 protein [Nitzschia inconspicua]|uniref:Glycosyl hydrolase family 16 protein n=1 Tax=Nitzschia inconspicua TaxID=303405 RepID=A0A9K3PL76_9STRA|nr:glycosyl hydrolase family 16 protein [Nitzschia inconspicua]